MRLNEVIFRAHRAFGGFATTLYYLGLFAGMMGFIGGLLFGTPPFEINDLSFNVHVWPSFAVVVVVTLKTYLSYFKKQYLYKNQRAKWFGIATAEFKIDPRDGVPKLMEVNPRLFGYTNLAIKAGIDLPYILYKVAKNEEVYKSTTYKKISFSRILHDLYILYKEFTDDNMNLSQRKTVLIDFINSYFKEPVVFDYLSYDDLLPFFSSMLCIIFTPACKI